MILRTRKVLNKRTNFSRDTKALITFLITSIGVVVAHWVFVSTAGLYDTYLCKPICTLVGPQVCFTIGFVLSLWSSVFFVVIPFWWFIKRRIWPDRPTRLQASTEWDKVVREIMRKNQPWTKSTPKQISNLYSSSLDSPNLTFKNFYFKTLFKYFQWAINYLRSKILIYLNIKYVLF